MIRISWRSLLTEYEGHGNWRNDSDMLLLKAWLERLKTEMHVMHWIERRETKNES